MSSDEETTDPIVKNNRIGDDSDENENEEDIIKPSQSRPGIYSEEDDDDEEEEEEITEEDRRFIVDDDDEEDEDENDGRNNDDDGSDEDRDDEREIRKKKKKRRRRSDDEEDLDEDDLDLIQDNLGIRSEKKFKKLRKKGDEDGVEKRVGKAVTLDTIFAEDDEEGEREKYSKEDERLNDRDELDDFIVTESDSEAEAISKIKKMKVKKNLKSQEQILKQYGISEAAQDDIEAIFGNGTEYLWVLQLKNISYEDTEIYVPEGGLMQLQEQKSVKLTDVYEPTEIKNRMLTEEDEEIRVTDLPERYQSIELKELTEEDLQRESKYIAKTMVDERKLTDRSFHETLFVQAVQQVIKFIRVKHYEVPYIYAHKKDFLYRQLDRNDIWRIYDLDVQYLSFQKRLEKLKNQYKDLQNGMEEEGVAGIGSDPYLEKSLVSLTSLFNEKINDIQIYMQLTYGEQLSVFDAKKVKTFKRAKKRTPYEEGIKAGLGDFAKLFNINVSHYARSLASRTQTHFPHDLSPSPPEIAALQFKSSSFQTAESVLEATRHMVAYQMSCNPELRGFLRSVYNQDAVISVTPTEKGRLEIDPSHPYYSFKYLKEKEISRFIDGQFLQIQAAEQEGLVSVEIRVDAEDKLLEDTFKFIVSDYSSENSKKWNEEREKIAELAMRQYLFPISTKHIRERLLNEAVNYVTLQCQIELMKKIDVAPWKPVNSHHDEYTNDLDEDEEAEPPGFKAMGISWGDGMRNSPTVAVIVNQNGELADFLQLDQLQDTRSELREQELQMLNDFISNHKPQVVFVGGWTPSTKTRLYEDVKKVVQEVNMSSGGWNGEESQIECIIVEDDLARLYMNSKQGAKDFPSDIYPPLVRYCVSLCRRSQDPISEFAYFCSETEDSKLLRLHPLQTLIPEEKYYQVIERTFMNVVASCGVDINQAVLLKHKSATLQYVSGLGPRKAQAFLTKIGSSKGSRLDTRENLILQRLCGSLVFTNCASFIRIRRYHFFRNGLARDEYWDILDDTRIHPEDYELARKMAADALEVVDAAMDEEDYPSQHVRDLVRGKLHMLNELELGDYAEQLEKTLGLPKSICLNEIKDELMRPYQERRKKFEPPSPDHVFYLLINETEESLHKDMVLSNCPVLKVFDKFVKVGLPSGSLEGTIPLKFLSDGMISTCSEEAQVGQVLSCRVMNIDKEKFQVDLSARIRDVNDALDMQQLDRKKKDPNFSDEWERMDTTKKRRVERKVVKKKIALHHPFFKQVDYREAENQLKDMPNGEVIVRPSTKGPNHISITWKVGPGVYQHIDMKEDDSEGNKVYEVDGKSYSELDEYLELAVNPLARNVQDVMKGSKYMNYDLEEMGTYVTQQCKLTRRSAYGFILCREKPGRFYMVYRHPQNQLRHEYINVLSDGYLFRNKKFRSIEDLVMFFKKDEQKRAERSASGRHQSHSNLPGYGGSSSRR